MQKSKANVVLVPRMRLRCMMSIYIIEQSKSLYPDLGVVKLYMQPASTLIIHTHWAPCCNLNTNVDCKSSSASASDHTKRWSRKTTHQRLVFILVPSVYPKTEMLLQSTKRLQPRDTKDLEKNKSIDDFVCLEVAAFLHCYSDNFLDQPFSRLIILEDCGGRRAEKQRFLLLPIISCVYWGGTVTAKVRNQQNCKRTFERTNFDISQIFSSATV